MKRSVANRGRHATEQVLQEETGNDFELESPPQHTPEQLPGYRGLVNVSLSELESDEAENGTSSHSRDGTGSRSFSASQEELLAPSGEGKTVSGCNSQVESATDDLRINGQATTRGEQTTAWRGQTTTKGRLTSAQRG